MHGKIDRGKKADLNSKELMHELLLQKKDLQFHTKFIGPILKLMFG